MHSLESTNQLFYNVADIACAIKWGLLRNRFLREN